MLSLTLRRMGGMALTMKTMTGSEEIEIGRVRILLEVQGASWGEYRESIGFREDNVACTVPLRLTIMISVISLQMLLGWRCW